MFEKLRRLVNNSKKLNANLLLNEILKDRSFQEFILDLNRKDQLLEGINSLGVELSPYSPFKKPESVTYKGVTKTKQANAPVILFDTGIFYESFKISLGSDFFEINANGVRDDVNLFDEYGAEILGISPENLEVLQNAIRVKITKEVLQKITA